MQGSHRYRVLQICSSSALSGAERHVYSLATSLRSRGHEVASICPEPGWLTASLTDAGVSSSVRWMKGLDWWRTMAHLVRRVRRDRVDVVHTHLTRAAYLGHALGLLTRTPIVTSVHIANNDQIYRRLAWGRNRLVAVSNFVAGMLHGNGVPERFIDTVYNGTDFFDLEPTRPHEALRELGIADDRRVVGLVAKVCPDKSQLELVEAMGAVVAEHTNAHLMLVGQVADGFRPEIDRAIERSGMRGRVTLTGVRQDVPRLIDALTLSTLPSRMETFGVAAIEAMARGKAVVATRAGAIPEVVRHRQTGLLVDLRPDAIAEAISYLLANDGLREEMGRMGRQIARQKFGLAEMTSRFEKVYETAVIGTPPRPR